MSNPIILQLAKFTGFQNEASFLRRLKPLTRLRKRRLQCLRGLRIRLYGPLFRLQRLQRRHQG